jgi:hypothetical protein
MPSPPKPLFAPPASQTGSSQDAEVPDLREIIRQARQRKLDDVVTRRIELRRAKDRVREQEAAVRGEKSRLDSLASVEQARELWRLQEKNHTERKRLRDEAGIRAGGQFKRPAATQLPIDPSPKRTLRRLEGRRLR